MLQLTQSHDLKTRDSKKSCILHEAESTISFSTVHLKQGDKTCTQISYIFAAV